MMSYFLLLLMCDSAESELSYYDENEGSIKVEEIILDIYERMHKMEPPQKFKDEVSKAINTRWSHIGYYRALLIKVYIKSVGKELDIIKFIDKCWVYPSEREQNRLAFVPYVETTETDTVDNILLKFDTEFDIIIDELRDLAYSLEIDDYLSRREELETNFKKQLDTLYKTYESKYSEAASRELKRLNLLRLCIYISLYRNALIKPYDEEWCDDRRNSCEYIIEYETKDCTNRTFLVFVDKFEAEIDILPEVGLYNPYDKPVEIMVVNVKYFTWYEFTSNEVNSLCSIFKKNIGETEKTFITKIAGKFMIDAVIVYTWIKWLKKSNKSVHNACQKLLEKDVLSATALNAMKEIYRNTKR